MSASKPHDPESLAPGLLIDEAQARTGLSDFGDDGFREGLDVLCDALEREAGLHAVGRATQHARILDSLAARLSVVDHLAAHPEILEEDLGDPVVIVGLMRTGTTRLHRLLGAGPAFRTARWWEVRHPAPFPGSDWRNDDPRIAAAREEVRVTLETVPLLASVHPWDAEGADEEVMLLEHAFTSWVPESGAHVPSYAAWLDAQDLRPSYRYLADLLRFIQWQQREAQRGPALRPTRWILKSPFHLAYLDALFDVFPGVRVLQTHRDPLETIPSGASMYRALRLLGSDTVDPVACGTCVRDRFRRALERCMRWREKQPADRFLDVDYRAVGRDPLGEAQRVYDWLGLDCDRDATRAMRIWLDANARDERPAHAYSLEEFGLDAEGLQSDFCEYRTRHVLPVA